MNKALKIADMSALPLRVVPDRTARTEQNRQAKQRQRERERVGGFTEVHVKLSAEQVAQLTWLRQAQSGDMESFLVRALMTGAKFVYNSGNVRGGKKRIKGGWRP
ncbi:MAG TPA: hypothetical protein VGM54_10115 [Chthoniobacter sp.]|jgi:hypothetical protein